MIFIAWQFLNEINGIKKFMTMDVDLCFSNEDEGRNKDL